MSAGLVGIPGFPQEQASTPDPVLELVLASRTFQRSAASQRLLRYLWQQRGTEPNEYAIGVDALGKRADFDPRLDAAVRVQVARLRQRLAEYYGNEGQQAAERLEIPSGTYRLRLVPAPAPSRPLELIPAPAVRPALPRYTRVLLAACVLLLGVSGALGYRLWSLQQQPRPAVAAPRFWRQFFATDRPTRIVVPTPVFFAWRGSSIRARDVAVNDFGELSQSADLAALTRRFGAPELVQAYTVASDTYASTRLAQYLQQRGWDVSITGTADTPAEALTHDRLILLGTAFTLTPYRDQLKGMGLELALEKGQTVLDRRPAPGGPARYLTQPLAPEHSRQPAVMALLPGQSAGSDTLVLESSRTNGLVSLLTSAAGQAAWERLWQRAGSPRYWEALVTLECHGETVLRAEPTFVRPLPARN